MKLKYLFICLLALSLIGCTKQQHQGDFQPFVGTNFWYGAILASTGTGGDRDRLERELDTLHALGLNNLRILVGSDGERGVNSKVEPTLQIAPGVYNDTILDGLDYLLSEMQKRGMQAVLYMNNSWEWSGGYGQYLEWAGRGKAPVPNIDGWPAYMEYIPQYMQCDSAKSLFADHVRFILSRQNRYTGKKYTEDPTIFSWQIGNEPRAFSDENKEAFYEWIQNVSKLFRELDQYHRLSVGTEGLWGCEMDIDLFERIHALPEIDYLTIHIWPYNWGWLRDENGEEDIQSTGYIEKVRDYIRQHEEVAERLGKPITLEEFGFPRDNFDNLPDISSNTTARDRFYEQVFRWVQSDEEFPHLRGCNFWAWGGEAKPQHRMWQAGDPYIGDPAQEPQGWNSVFLSDSTTLNIIIQHSH